MRKCIFIYDYSRLVRVWVGDGQRSLGLQLLVPGRLPPGNLLNLTLELSESDNDDNNSDI